MSAGVTELVYVADPMCSWCWGFAGVLERLREALPEGVRETLVLGGLAPDSEEPMDPATRAMVQGAWDAVEARTGARFERAFWSRCEPRRSTWPACRGVLAAEAQRPGAGWEFFGAVQRAYYLEARNPSDRSVLVELAGGLHPALDTARFAEDLDGEGIHRRFAEDRARAAALGAGGFPWLGLVVGSTVHALSRGWSPAERVLEALARALPKDPGISPPSGTPGDWGTR